MSRPGRVHHAKYRILERGGFASYVRDSSSGPVYYTWRVGQWACRHWRVTGPLLFFWFLWGSGGFTSVVLFGVLALGFLTAWVLWRRAEGAAGSTRVSLEDQKAKAALRRQWPLACKSAKLLGPESGEAPKLVKLTGNGHGTLTARVESGRIGVPVVDVVKSAPRLADVIGCREVVVTPDGPGVASLAFHWKDPIGRLLPLADLPIAADGQLAYGIRQDAAVASLKATQSVLIGGLTRHGKSNLVWSLLADALRQGMHVDLYVSDPKGGVELDQLEAAVGREHGLLRVRQYAKTAAETVRMCDAAEKAMHARQFYMKQNGVRKIQPSQENPLVVVILDETLPLTDLLKKGTDSSLGRIAYTGAAAGYVVWANTQVAQIDSIGRFRDLVPQRVCFATSAREVTDAVLGAGAEALGARCSEITEPGVGYSHSEGDKRYKKFRAAMVTDAETRAIADGVLPAKVVNAAREAYDRRELEDSTTAGRSRKDRRTALYRWYYVDSEEYGDSLGYVGISYDVLRREQQHSAALRAFMEGNVRREVVYYPTRVEAEAAERLAIEQERPIHNVVHNGVNRRAWLRKPVKAA